MGERRGVIEMGRESERYGRERGGLRDMCERGRDGRVGREKRIERDRKEKESERDGREGKWESEGGDGERKRSRD